MSRAERLQALQALEQVRGSRVISYVTSTRPGAESQMAMDAIEPLYRHLSSLRNGTTGELAIDLFIHSNGGDGIVPWRIVTLIREFTDRFTVLVPHRAFSAATLTALGATQVLMHPMGMLGPTDPTVTNAFNPPNPNAPGQLLGISVEDVTSYFSLVKDDIGIRHEDELIKALDALTASIHPLALGNVKRSTLQSRLLAEKLLRCRNSSEMPLTDHVIQDIIRKLTSELYFHGHPINRQEAREEVGLDFVLDASPEVADAMWQLYETYRTDMKLESSYLPMQEALASVGGSVGRPQFNHPPTVAEVALPTAQTAFIESADGCNAFEAEHTVTVLRDYAGAYNANVTVTRQGWIADWPAQP